MIQIAIFFMVTPTKNLTIIVVNSVKQGLAIMCTELLTCIASLSGEIAQLASKTYLSQIHVIVSFQCFKHFKIFHYS